MISGKFEDINIFSLGQSILKRPKSELGNIYVRYGQPIDLKAYLEQNDGQSFKQVTMQLTQ